MPKEGEKGVENPKTILVLLKNINYRIAISTKPIICKNVGNFATREIGTDSTQNIGHTIFVENT